LSRFHGTFHSFDPVGFAIFAILAAAQFARNFSKDSGIEIICDAESKNAPLGREIAEWRTERLRRTTIVTPQLAQPDRPVSFDYRASLGCTSLQAADVIAHGAPLGTRGAVMADTVGAAKA
jgi:hypothetical protein